MENRKKRSEYWQLWIVPKPLFLGTVLMKKTLFLPLSRNSTGLIKRKRLVPDEGAVRKVWIIMECRCITEDSQVRVYLSEVRGARWKSFGRFLKKAAHILFRPVGSVGLTYLYAIWAAERAFIQRGYVAYGGEYMVIPFIFYGLYKGLGAIEKLVCQDAVYGGL